MTQNEKEQMKRLKLENKILSKQFEIAELTIMGIASDIEGELENTRFGQDMYFEKDILRELNRAMKKMSAQQSKLTAMKAQLTPGSL